MGITVLPQEPGLAELLGAGIGTGVAGGLQQLVQQQMQRKEQEKQAKVLSEGLQKMGVSEEQAKGIARLPKELQQLILKEQLAAPRREEFGKALSAALGITPTEPRAEGLAAAAGTLPEQDQLKLVEVAQRERKEKGRIATQRNIDVLKRTDQIREALPIKENALTLMKDAIGEGNLGFFSRDNLAQLTGVEGFRTAKGAQFITAGKEFFLGSIQRAGARPNIFIEKQIAKMMPQIGRSREANATVAAAMEADLDVERERLRLTDEIEERFIAEQGFAPPNLGARVSKELKPFAENRQKDLMNELRSIQKGEMAPAREEEIVPGQMLEKLPNPAIAAGKTIRNNKTGKIYRSDGKKWTEVR